jgi:8-oxo-dGTP pyrophosphatase MutT (NUDIX family)
VIGAWRKKRSEKVFDCRIFSLHVSHSQAPGGDRSNEFYVLESRDWCNIIPVTADGKVVMIHQYRHGIEGITLEIPGGIVDSTDASPLRAARREMVEETGYDSQEIIPIGVVHPNPAILNNRCHSFLAKNVRFVQRQQLDRDEETELMLVPLVEIPDCVQKGLITHALVVVAFYWLGFKLNGTSSLNL